MSTSAADRFTTLPDNETLTTTVVALEEHGFSVEVVHDLDAAREAVLARIPAGSSVMTNTSVTLQETGIEQAINDGGTYQSVRKQMLALDYSTQGQAMKAMAAQADFAVGSVHATTPAANATTSGRPTTPNTTNVRTRGFDAVATAARAN